MLICLNVGIHRGQKKLCDRLGLTVGTGWEEDRAREWILVGVRMHGIADRLEQKPIAVVMLNVRTKQVAAAPNMCRDITNGTFRHPSLHEGPETVVLGTPPYIPIAAKPGSFVIMGAEYYVANHQ